MMMNLLKYENSWQQIINSLLFMQIIQIKMT